MDVYLVPIGHDRYELYCEVASSVSDDDGPASSWWGRFSQSFHRAVAEGEAERHEPSPTTGSSGRIRRFIKRKLAQAVAEQRLLWNLRRQPAARLVHPDDLAGHTALARSRALITADRDKHRKRAIVNAVLLALSGPIAFVPGPNLLAYYFTFRTVGHYLSKRGADHGLARVTWTTSASTPLRELRDALGLSPGDRTRQIDRVADLLGLERLPRFVAGVTERPS